MPQHNSFTSYFVLAVIFDFTTTLMFNLIITRCRFVGYIIHDHFSYDFPHDFR